MKRILRRLSRKSSLKGKKVYRKSSLKSIKSIKTTKGKRVYNKSKKAKNVLRKTKYLKGGNQECKVMNNSSLFQYHHPTKSCNC